MDVREHVVRVIIQMTRVAILCESTMDGLRNGPPGYRPRGVSGPLELTVNTSSWKVTELG